MSQIIYPVCDTTFKKWLNDNYNYFKFYKSLNPRIFDVSLRDGLQSIIKEEQIKYSTDVKIQIYYEILNKYNLG